MTCGVCGVRGVGGDGTNLANIVCMYVCKYVCIETTELPTQQCGSSVISFQQNHSQHVTFELLVLCRFAFVRRQHMPALHRPSCMISNVNSLNGAKQKHTVLKFEKSGNVSGEKQSGTMCMYVCIQMLYVSLYGRTSLRVSMCACFIVSIINQNALVCAGLQTYSAALRQCCNLILTAHR